MLTRRAAALAAGALLALPRSLQAAEGSSLKLGLLEFGTASWEIETMRRLGFDRAAGIGVETVRLASNEAARIAFMGGAVDTVVGDLLWAARLRGEGRDVVFMPFSSTEGGVMVPAASPIRSVADLHGIKLGVSGGPLDKSWLLLQAVARQDAGLDLAGAVEPAFGAPPLLSQKLASGELDAALLYWAFCARLQAKGFRQLIGTADLCKALGVEAPISFLGWLFDNDRLGERRALLPAFAAASRQTRQRLATGDEAWQSVRALMQADDEATYQALRQAFLAGFPKRPVAAEEADAGRLYAVLAKLGGSKLVGTVDRLPPGLYWSAPS